MFGKQRSQAAWRVLAFVYLYVVSIVASIIAIVAIVWGAVDVIWQLITNRNDLSEDSTPARLVTAVYMWVADLFVFSTTGGGTQELQWTPARWL